MKEQTQNKLKELYGVEIKVIPVFQIINYNYGPDVWLVENLIPDNSITAISGMPGSFKTWLTLELARCVSKGEDFLGKFKVTKNGVLFVDKENHQKHIQSRLKKIGVDEDDDIFYLNNEDFSIDVDKDFNQLTQAISVLGVKVVVFDSLVRIHKGDENESQHIAKVMGKFRKITNLGVNVIFIHHHRKEKTGSKNNANSLRGSSDILAGIDCLLVVEKSQNKNNLVINQAKLRQQEALEPFSVKIISDDNKVELKYEGEHDPKGEVKTELKKIILELLAEKDEIGRKELIEMLEDDYSTAVIDDTLKELQPNYINKRKAESNKYFFSLKK